MLSKSTLLTLLAATSAVLAQVTPTSPSGTTVVKEGDNIEALWDKDTTGSWTDLEIQLMTGDNWNMVPLSVLASGIDGTTTDSFTTPAPAVTPNSKIYFLQFTRAGNVSTATWTTRFTIAAADGTTTDPTETTQPNGDQIAWGTGALVSADGSSTNGTASSASASSGAASGVVASATSASSAVASASDAVSSASESATSVSAAASSTSSSSTSRSVSAANNAASASASASPSGAAIVGAKSIVGAGWLALAAVLGAVLA